MRCVFLVLWFSGFLVLSFWFSVSCCYFDLVARLDFAFWWGWCIWIFCVFGFEGMLRWILVLTVFMVCSFWVSGFGFGLQFWVLFLLWFRGELSVALLLWVLRCGVVCQRLCLVCLVGYFWGFWVVV